MKPVLRSLKIDVLYSSLANAGDKKRIMLLYEGNNEPHPFLESNYLLFTFFRKSFPTFPLQISQYVCLFLLVFSWDHK